MGEPRSASCCCGVQSGCKTKRCECVVQGVFCDATCGCGSECTRRWTSGGYAIMATGVIGRSSYGCSCSAQSGCKTQRCQCVVQGTSCGRACGCGEECSRKSILRGATGWFPSAGGVKTATTQKTIKVSDESHQNPAVSNEPIKSTASASPRDIDDRDTPGIAAGIISYISSWFVGPPSSADVQSTADPTSSCCRCRSECTPGSCKCVDLNVPCNTSCGCGGCQQKYDLRENVSKRTDEIWTYRGGVDVYTKLSRKKYQAQRTDTENDHVLEVQILNDVQKSLGPAYNTRAMEKSLKVIVNDVCNLNVTDHRINQAKKGPFTTWRNCYNNGNPISFDDAIERTSSVYGKTEMKDKGYWTNIKREVVNTYDTMADYLHDPGQILDYRPPKSLSTVADELERRLNAMKID